MYIQSLSCCATTSHTLTHPSLVPYITDLPPERPQDNGIELCLPWNPGNTMEAVLAEAKAHLHTLFVRVGDTSTAMYKAYALPKIIHTAPVHQPYVQQRTKPSLYGRF